jgi:hypothetical protein
MGVEAEVVYATSELAYLSVSVSDPVAVDINEFPFVDGG